MKIDINDPRITAFALGELQGRDAREMARAVHRDARIRKAVDEVRGTSYLLQETFGAGEAQMLTSSQRMTVRSAGGAAVITDIATRSHVPVWKRPLVAGLGVAAVVALTLYIVVDPVAVPSARSLADTEPVWDWSQVEMDELTSPVEVGEKSSVSASSASETTRIMMAAISDDTESYRKEVATRIQRSEFSAASKLPELEENDWVKVVPGKRFDVPMASGATSWPWLQRYVEEKKTLPPQRSVRIEEMINHFQYRTPSMLTTDALVADMEICSTPWNPSTLLLAVHVSPRPGAELAGAQAVLEFDSTRVGRAQLLGYGRIPQRDTKKISMETTARGRGISKSRGNYVLYELDLEGFTESEEPWATLVLGESSRLPASRVLSWIHASADLRFASMIAASGMMMAGNSSLGELDAVKLSSLLEMMQVQDGSVLSDERREALELMQKAAVLLDGRDENDPTEKN